MGDNQHMSCLWLPFVGRVYLPDNLSAFRSVCEFFKVPKVKFFTHTCIASFGYMVVVVMQLVFLPSLQKPWMRQAAALMQPLSSTLQVTCCESRVTSCS